MNLSDKQAMFTTMIGQLIRFADHLGYGLTFGDAYRDPRCTYGHSNSLHRKRLAVDFNLFIKGEYQTDTDAYYILGRYWEALGGSWGGRFQDGNHFSLEHEGMR